MAPDPGNLLALDFSTVGRHADEFRWKAVRDVLERGVAGAAPRTRIPSETYIAQRAGVSGRTVRKAIHDLRDRGLLYTVSGLGSFVGPRD
jgi:DNA-binding GntR family transcriptional regulator